MSRDPRHLHPALREFWDVLAVEVKRRLGLTIFLTCTYRSNAAQDALYAKGRTVPGAKVTKARAGQSPHNVPPQLGGSHALDFAVRKGEKGVTWNRDKYMAVAQIARELGADCGAFWRGFRDPPHIQLPRWRRGKRYPPGYRFMKHSVASPKATPPRLLLSFYGHPFEEQKSRTIDIEDKEIRRIKINATQEGKVWVRVEK